jgi:hypothetical protein
MGNQADGQARTDDLRFTKPLLYRLSYVGVLSAGQIANRHFLKGLPTRLLGLAATPESLQRQGDNCSAAILPAESRPNA